ncbi:unnamed protein product, partial [Closterium sp. NIES-53]
PRLCPSWRTHTTRATLHAVMGPTQWKEGRAWWAEGGEMRAAATTAAAAAARVIQKTWRWKGMMRQVTCRLSSPTRSTSQASPS